MAKWQRKHISDEAVCLACLMAHTNRQDMSYQIIQRAFPDCPVKVIYAAMERASYRELIDWGVSLRSAWVTEKGMELLGDWGRWGLNE